MEHLIAKKTASGGYFTSLVNKREKVESIIPIPSLVSNQSSSVDLSLENAALSEDSKDFFAPDSEDKNDW